MFRGDASESVAAGHRLERRWAGLRRRGIAASSGALALTLLGHTDIVVYDGSLNEWAADPDAVLTVG